MPQMITISNRPMQRFQQRSQFYLYYDLCIPFLQHTAQHNGHTAAIP